MTIWKEDLNNRKKNLGGLLSNPSTRPILFMMAGLLVGMLVLGYMTMGRANSDAVPPSATVVRTGDDVKVDPSRGGSSAHSELQGQKNAADVEEAMRAGRTVLPTIESSRGSNNPLELPALPSNSQTPNPTAPAPTLPTIQAPAPVQPQPQPQAPVVAQAPQPVAPRKASDGMTEQIAGYLSLWGPRSNQFQEFEYARTAEQEKGAVPDAQAPAGTMAPVAAAPEVKSKIRFVRSGSVVPARLLTPLTSDNPGPVLAEITSGPLKGARMIGSMSVQREGIMVQFSQIMKPGWPDNYAISAVGLSDDGYTGMATDVNHHYFQRYTALLAGNFLQGYGQGLSQTGSSTIITDGTVVSDVEPLNSEEIRNKGYGEVAQAIGEEVEEMSERPTTIEIKGKDGAPYAFQVLFLQGF